MGITWRLAILSVPFYALTTLAAQDVSHAHAAARPSPDSSWSELTSSMEKMHRTMASVESSGNDDVDFVALMLPHHQAAIDMARAELQHGTDPALRRLAQEIVTDQQSEIDLMQLWVKHR